MSADEVVRALTDLLVVIPAHEGYLTASASWEVDGVSVSVTVSAGDA